MTSQRRVEICRARAVGQSAKASPSIARFILLPSASAGCDAHFPRHIQLAFASSESLSTQARVTALFAQAAAPVQARIGVAQVDFRVAHVMLSHSYNDPSSSK